MDTCKICGAPRDPLNTNCKFCGTTYTLDKITGEVYVAGLQTILRRIEQEAGAERSSMKSFKDEFTTKAWTSGPFGIAQRQKSAISTFATPSDVENLFQFFAFCHGNAQMVLPIHDHVGENLKGAWNGKAKMAFTQLKMKSIANPSLAPYIAEYEHLYGASVNPLSSSAKQMIALFSMMIVSVFLISFSSSRSNDAKMANIAKEKGRLDAIVLKVQTQILARDYDGAEAFCADISWTWENRWNEAQAKAYDQKRQDLKALIAEARKNSTTR